MTGLEIAGIVSVVLNFVLGLFARKNRKAAKLVQVIIKGVEAASTGAAAAVNPKAGKGIKDAIKTMAIAAGVEPILNKEVKRITAK